jgi:hypothetical protein
MLSKNDLIKNLVQSGLTGFKVLELLLHHKLFYHSNHSRATLSSEEDNGEGRHPLYLGWTP